jgi:N2-citryl-N6-acetyl-N6-hydroxylysine synthase
MLPIKLGATTFFNAFFMECDSKRTIGFNGGEALSVPLKDRDLIVPLKRHSKLGRHEYTSEFYVQDEHSLEKVPFERAAELLLAEMGAEYKRLFSRVIESVDNIDAILKSRKDLSDLWSLPVDFLSAEQGLIAGHSCHPAPKGREGLTLIDAKLYSPEMAAAFPLRWFWVKEELIYERSSMNFDDKNWLEDMLKNEIPALERPKGYLAFPMHPWQAKRLLEMPQVISHLSSSAMIEIDELGSDWMPTSSFRSLYHPHAAYMLKFSMSVKLTNSVRHMQKHELERGLQVHDMIQSDKGQEFVFENPTFNILAEPVYRALKDEQGRPIEESYVMGRESIPKNKNLVMLAMLTQDHPNSEMNLLQRLIHQHASEKKHRPEESAKIWFEHFCDHVVLALMNAQAQYGILLGAHQQNLLIELKGHLPVGGVFRDCHGTGLSPLGEMTFNFVKSATVLDPVVGNKLFSYYLIINSVFGTIGALCQDHLVAEEKLIEILRERLLKLKSEGVKDPSCLDYLLSSEKLGHKGNFLCSLKNINESTLGDPLSIYVDIDNPFYIKGSSL